MMNAPLYQPVTPTEFAAIEDLGGWRYVLGSICVAYRAGTYTAAGELAAAAARAADEADHHPDMSLAYPDLLQISLTTHAIGGLTTHDVDLAHTIAELAAVAGAMPVLDPPPEVT